MNVLTKTKFGENLTIILLFFAVFLPFVMPPFNLGTRTVEAESFPRALGADDETHHPMSVTAQAKKNAVSQIPAQTQIGYHASVMKALKKMGLVADHFDAWIDQHPGTALKHVKFMPWDMQENVAGTALFIRKSNAKIDEKTAWREAAALVHYSAKYGVPSALTTAVAHAESTFDPNAVSPKGASGVMQVMWNIHNRLLQSNGIMGTPGSNPLADPEQAIAAGCLLLSRYIRAYGNAQNAMDRYYGSKSTAYRNKITRNIARILDHHAELKLN